MRGREIHLKGGWCARAAFRVRIALHLKGLPFETIPVHVLRNGGEQHAPGYRRVSPLGIVPALEDGNLTLTQSLAICEYLEERHPEPPLLPGTPGARARPCGGSGDRLRDPSTQQSARAALSRAQVGRVGG
jgi:glutathione S-transferase